jgi:hypothetical protein
MAKVIGSIGPKVSMVGAYWKILIPLSLVHFSGDFYSSFISPLFPVSIDKIGLSLIMASGTV